MEKERSGCGTGLEPKAQAPRTPAALLLGPDVAWFLFRVTVIPGSWGCSVHIVLAF
jgi:hypothetical protein